MRLIWTRKALSQKDAIWDFLAERSPLYADRVETRILVRVASLTIMPEQGRRLRADARRLSIPDIQYFIDYRIEEDAIRILRVRSTAQDEDR